MAAPGRGNKARGPCTNHQSAQRCPVYVPSSPSAHDAILGLYVQHDTQHKARVRQRRTGGSQSLCTGGGWAGNTLGGGGKGEACKPRSQPHLLLLPHTSSRSGAAALTRAERARAVARCLCMLLVLAPCRALYTVSVIRPSLLRSPDRSRLARTAFYVTLLSCHSARCGGASLPCGGVV